jgi:hypothetical protein
MTKNIKLPLKKVGLFCLDLNLLIFNSWGILPLSAATQTGELNIINSQEDAKQLINITNTNSMLAEKPTQWLKVGKKPNSRKLKTQSRRFNAGKKANPGKAKTQIRRVTVPKTTPQLKPVTKVTPPNFQEDIDQLEAGVRLDVTPNSNQPISK